MNFVRRPETPLHFRQAEIFFRLSARGTRPQGWWGLRWSAQAPPTGFGQNIRNVLKNDIFKVKYDAFRIEILGLDYSVTHFEIRKETLPFNLKFSS